MSTSNPARTILIVTTGLLAFGGVVAIVGASAAADVIWAAAALLPLLRLLRQLVADLLARRAGVDVIAALAVSGALLLHEFLAAAVVGAMLATGDFLEEYASGRARAELSALAQRAPRIAHRVVEGEAHVIPVDDVMLGDRLLVTAGEVIPVDGVLVDEPALVDESAVTGESMPVRKLRGDLVSSGTVNAAGPFMMSATATAEASTYAGIVRLVAQAHASRPPSVRLADRWAAWFIPFTLLVSTVAWAVSGDPERALSVLVVATPCPLLLAVPISIVSGISRAAKAGIVFRGGGPLETLARIRNLLIDKTGTITIGEPVLRDVVVFDSSHSSDELLRLAASIDQISTHVLARAIVAAARGRGLTLEMPDSPREAPGSGVVGMIGGRPVGVGSLSWLLDGAPEPVEVAEFRRRLDLIAPMTAFVSVGGEVSGALTFDDVIRPDAAATLLALRRAGVDRIVMATGDHPTVAAAVGMAIDVDDVLSECTPSDKVDAVHDLARRGLTAMVGDGINDAPALAAADVGIAMGGRGATASSEAASVVLMVDRLDGLVDAIAIAKRSRSIAVQSVVIGMGLSVVAMLIATTGLISPIAGAIAQEAIDVIAIANALRALTGTSVPRTRPSLSPALSKRLRAEHDALHPRIDEIALVAEALDEMTMGDARSALIDIARFLRDDLVPHEKADDEAIYPQLSEMLGGDDPLRSMSRTHREIFRLAGRFERIVDDMPDSGPDAADVRDIRRLLRTLHAVLRLHFAQEEMLYASLDGASTKQ